MRTLLFLFLSSSAFAADLPYKNGDFGCTPQADADRYISDFSVDVDSFGGLELCDAGKDTKKLLNDLYLVEHAEFTADTNHTFIHSLVPFDNYYNWMKGETRGMQRGNDVPFATAYNRGGYFTMQNGWAALSSLGRVGTVIHEARHTEGYVHTQCTHGPYMDSEVSGCDNSVAEGGSHAVEMEYYTRVVLDAKNLHPVYRSMARLMALGRSNFVFNESPIKSREALLGKAGDQMILVDGQNVYNRTAPEAEPGSLLKRTSFGASLVNGKKAVAVDLYGATNNDASISDDYSYYKMFTSPRESEPKAVNDTAELDIGGKRFFAVLGEGGKIYSFDFPKGAWNSTNSGLPRAGVFVTRTPTGESGLFVVTIDGNIVPFDFSSLSFGQPLREMWTKDTLAYANDGTILVKLTASGQVVNAKTGEAISAFSGKKLTDLVNVPLYDAYEVAR